MVIILTILQRKIETVNKTNKWIGFTFNNKIDVLKICSQFASPDPPCNKYVCLVILCIQNDRMTNNKK